MKLRNKKTGEIAEFDFVGAVAHQDGKIVDSLQYGLIAMFCDEWEDYEPEPEETELIEELEEATKRADARAGRALEKIVELTATLKASISRIDKIEERLKTTEEITERLLREDNEQILGGKVKQYEPAMPQSEKFERMKKQLRDWIDKKPKIEHIEVNFVEDEKANNFRLGVQFLDADDNRDIEDFDIIIWDWPRVGLVDGEIYTPDELLITGEAGKE